MQDALNKSRNELVKLDSEVAVLFGVADIEFALIFRKLLDKFDAMKSTGTYFNTELDFMVMTKFKEKPIDTIFRLTQIAYRYSLDVNKDFIKIVKKSGLMD